MDDDNAAVSPLLQVPLHGLPSEVVHLQLILLWNGTLREGGRDGRREGGREGGGMEGGRKGEREGGRVGGER